jgi:hypothetical protein
MKRRSCINWNPRKIKGPIGCKLGMTCDIPCGKYYLRSAARKAMKKVEMLKRKIIHYQERLKET